MKALMLAAGLLALSAGPLAADTAGGIAISPNSLTWKPATALPKGAEVAVLFGDPAKPGLVVMRLKFPPNYKIAPHMHDSDETGTVLSGSYTRAMGEKFDTSKGDKLAVGYFFLNPAHHAHYAWTGDEAVIVQLQVIGPWTITYVNPADDPRNQAKAGHS